METYYSNVRETVGIAAPQTPELAIREAGLDWEPILEPIQTVSSESVPRKRAVLRSDTREVLGIVSPNYHPSDPREFVRDQYHLASELGGSVSRLGFIPGLSRAFAFVNIGDFRVKEDKIKCYIYSSDGWNGMKARSSRLFVERQVCRNGLTLTQLHDELWVSHTAEMKRRYQIKMEKLRESVVKHVEKVVGIFQYLAESPLSRSQAQEYIEKLFPGEQKRRKQVRELVFELFWNGLGNRGQTRWDLLNAVTEYTNHRMNRHRTSLADKTTSRFLGILERDSLTKQALNLLSP